jgi:hypothetical protein
MEYGFYAVRRSRGNAQRDLAANLIFVAVDNSIPLSVPISD